VESDAERRGEVGRLAGMLFTFIAVVALGANQLLVAPVPASGADYVAVLGLLCGVACFLVPWRALTWRASYAIPVAATGLIALLAGQVGDRHGPVYAWFYVLVAVFCAYAYRSRRAVAGQLALVAFAAALPALYGADRGEELVRAFVAVPTLVLAGGMVLVVRERLEARQRALHRLARRDPLTGVGNYGALHERLAYELARHERHRRQLALMVLDLDRFKSVNERYGHQMGDELLRHVGEVLTRTVREEDTVCRQGGDEFSILAPETGANEAAALARRIERALGRIVVGSRRLGTSVGWAVYPDEATTPEALLARADEVQRAVKERGRRAEGAAA
jgi:diguanylate cyclase (GGDEF)-like protein